MLSHFLEKIPRHGAVEQIHNGLRLRPVTVILGPRQCGKTHLVRAFASRPENYFDLHNIVDRARVEDSNFKILDGLEGVVVVDEAQFIPEIFVKLRVLADRPESSARFIVTGSASPEVQRGVSESMAGRAHRFSLNGFTTGEVGWKYWQKLWLRGGFPVSYLSADERDSLDWRHNYISDFLERDLPSLVETKISREQLRRLLLLLANSHCQHWNHSSAGTMLGLSSKTVQRYVDLFKGAFLLRELPLFHANIEKRLRKAPKLCFRDSGVLHALLMIRDFSQLEGNPIYGHSWEGFGIEQVIRLTQSRDEECFSWSVPGGQEVDLVLEKPAGRFGFEFKAADAPRKTASMVTCAKDLQLRRLYVVYPGESDYELADQIMAIGIRSVERVCLEMQE